MKLNAAEIREIEKFLTARETGMTNGAVGAYFGLGDHAQQKASVAFGVLAKLGVRVASTPKRFGGASTHRAAAKGKPGRPKGSKDTKPRKQRSYAGVPRGEPVRPQPVRLTAEQWQERLSAHGF